MSSIQAVKANTSTKGSAWIASADKESKDTNVMFSDILQQLQTGRASGGSGGSSEETETVTRIMPDGTIRITVYQGSKIISQAESDPTPEGEKPMYLENQSGAVPTAASNVTSNSAATLMLNMLMQK